MTTHCSFFYRRCIIAKRFTDSRKWDDPWFTDLSNQNKLAWLYLLDKCDHYGIFKPNISLMNFQLKAKYTKEALLKIFKGRVIPISNDKWFIPKYIKFQYGDITSGEGRMTRTVLEYLKKNDLIDHINRVSTECQQSDDTLKDMVKNKDSVLKDSVLTSVLRKTTYRGKIEEFFDYFCLKTNKKLKLTDDRAKIIVKRLKEGRTLEELKQAVDNFILDDWSERDKFTDIIYCIGIRNKIDNLDRWLNFKLKRKLTEAQTEAVKSMNRLKEKWKEEDKQNEQTSL